MPEADRLGVPHLRDPSQRRNFLMHFRIKDSKTLEKILQSKPISFNNVRHPFERLASAYLEDDNKELNRFSRDGFERFVLENVLKPANTSQDKKTLFKLNHHWRPFNTYCAFCNINYTILSKTETFDKDRSLIMDRLGLNTGEPFKRLNMHTGKNIGDLTADLFNNISADVKTALQDLYKFDFEMFNYDPNIY